MPLHSRTPLLLSIALVATLSASWHLAKAQEAPQVVTIAGEDDWAPYSSAPTGRPGPEGLSPELVREAFKTQNVQVRFIALPFARCMLYAETGRVAGCFNASITDENRDKYHWHPTPMFHEGLAIFGRSEHTGPPLTEKDLEGRTVGVTIGYTYPTSFMSNARIAKLNARSDTHLLQMLAARRVDYILLNTMPGYYRIQQMPSLVGKVKQVGTIQMDGFWLAFSKKDPQGAELANSFEQGLRAMQADGSYDRLMAALRRRMGL